MKADVGQGGELNAALIPGPNHPKATIMQSTFLSSFVAWLVFVGVFGLYTLAAMAFHGDWWPLTAAFVFLVLLWVLNHFNPGKLP